MKRIITNSILLMEVIFFQSACYSDLLLTTPQDFNKYSEKKGVWVMKVIKTDGDSILYSRKVPGVLNDTSVIVKIQAEKSILKNQVDETRLNFLENRVAKFKKDGKLYRVRETNDSSFIYYGINIRSVRLNQITEIKAIKFQRATSGILLIGSISAVVTGLSYLLVYLALSNL